MTENELSNKLIGLAIEIYTALDPGLLESAYKECLYYKINKSGLWVEIAYQLQCCKIKGRVVSGL